MGVHERWHALSAHFFTPAELRGTGSTGADESPCGTIESVKMANGRKDLADLKSDHQTGADRQRPSCSPGPRTMRGGATCLHSCSHPAGSGRALLRLLPTVAASWPVGFLCHAHARFLSQQLQHCGEPEAESCFSEDGSGWNVEASLLLILHQRINQFKYKSIDKLFTSLFLSYFREAHRRKGESHFRLNN